MARDRKGMRVERPDLLKPQLRHQTCAPRLAALLAAAWNDAGLPDIVPGTLFFVTPMGRQRRDDVFRCSASFDAGITYYIDSWFTMTEMVRRGVVVWEECGDLMFGAKESGDGS